MEHLDPIEDVRWNYLVVTDIRRVRCTVTVEKGIAGSEYNNIFVVFVRHDHLFSVLEPVHPSLLCHLWKDFEWCTYVYHCI